MPDLPIYFALFTADLLGIRRAFKISHRRCFTRRPVGDPLIRRSLWHQFRCGDRRTSVQRLKRLRSRICAGIFIVGTDGNIQLSDMASRKPRFPKSPTRCSCSWQGTTCRDTSWLTVKKLAPGWRLLLLALFFFAIDTDAGPRNSVQIERRDFVLRNPCRCHKFRCRDEESLLQWRGAVWSRFVLAPAERVSHFPDSIGRSSRRFSIPVRLRVCGLAGC